MISNILIAAHLVDVMELEELEKYVISRISTLCDWKLLAQKCSVKVGKAHTTLKSDQRQLLIACWFVFLVLYLNNNSFYF